MHESSHENGWRHWQRWIGPLLFALALLGFWQQLRLARAEPSFPPSSARYPLQFEGLQAHDSEQLRFLIETLPVGHELRVRDGEGREYSTILRARQNPLQKLLTLVSGSAFFLIAIFVFGSHWRDPRMRDFHRAGLAYGLAVLTGGVYYAPGNLLLTLFDALHLMALMCAPFFFLRTSLSFPRAHPWRDGQPWLSRAAAISGAALLAWQLLAYGLYFAETNAARAGAIVAAKHAADLWLLLMVSLGCGILFYSGRHLELTREREEARWILWGIAIGITPYVFLRTLPELLGMPALVPAELDRLAELAIPASFAIAFFRYRIVDIDRLIRESLILAAAGAMLVTGYAIVSALFLPEAVARIGFLPLLIGVLAGLALMPLRERLGGWIDRALFSDQFQQGQDLERLRQILGEQRTVEAICVHMLRFLERRMAPEPLSIVLEDRGELRSAGHLSPQAARQLYEALRDGLPDGRNTLAAANSTTMPELEGDAELPHGLAQHNIELVQLIRHQDQIIGAILLGERAGGRRYAKGELELIHGLAFVAGRAHDRMQLSWSMIEESMRATHLDEIDRFRREFLSRVAHDLRTPLASISWSTDNLLDGIAGELGEEQSSYLRSMQIASRHLQHMLNNLLELSRLQNPEDRMQLGEVDLVEVATNACQVLAPVAGQRGIQLQLFAPERAVVQADAHRLLEALLNLLDNAIRYTEDRGEIQIHVDEGELRVRDHGPGLDSELLSHLFEAYRQGVPSPHSQRHGFGLGLHVTHELLTRMHAELEAGNANGGGAEFRVRFAPRYAEEP